jgi:branched-chain amino acid transport system ATP-binding protein
VALSLILPALLKPDNGDLIMQQAELVVQNLTKKFGGLSAVDNLSLTINQGEILGLIGPNGAGKTTTFNLITGFLRPDIGKIIYEGKEIKNLMPHEICKLGMTRTFQLAKPMYGMTIIENVLVGALNKKNTIKEALDFSKEILVFLGLEKFKNIIADNLPIGYHKLLELAKCLATQPKLLLLDEVMSGLNPSEIDLLLDKILAVRSKGVSIFLIEHVMEAVTSISDRIIVLNYGEKICEGSPHLVINDPKVIEAYLGDDFTIQ